MTSAVVLDVVAWTVWGFLVGFAGSRVPASRLAHDSWLTRPRGFERDGRLYERLAIRRWKDRLPEGGSLFGGRSKRHLPGRSSDRLAEFAVETRRAEIVHWLVLALVPVLVVLNPPPLGLIMAVYGIVANLPCIAIQRYNRARIARLTQRREQRRQRPAVLAEAEDEPVR